MKRRGKRILTEVHTANAKALRRKRAWPVLEQKAASVIKCRKFGWGYKRRLKRQARFRSDGDLGSGTGIFKSFLADSNVRLVSRTSENHCIRLQFLKSFSTKLAFINIIYNIIFINSKNTNHISIKFNGVIGHWNLQSKHLGPKVQGGRRYCSALTRFAFCKDHWLQGCEWLGGGEGVAPN